MKKSCCFSSNFLRRADRSLNGASDRPLREIGAGVCPEGKLAATMFGVRDESLKGRRNGVGGELGLKAQKKA